MKCHKYNLGFIKDQDLFEHVKETMSHFTKEIDLVAFEKNIVDPIKMTFMIHAYNMTPEQAVTNEVGRQIIKTVENAIGSFHQNIFKYIDGWEVPEDGVDVINTKGTIFGEIKNKYNTMNSSSADKVFDKLSGIVIGNPKATAYLIEVIAKKSQNKEWKVAGKSLSPERAKRLRQISIDEFYKLATGNQYAFRDLCSVLGLVIDDVLAAYPATKFKNTVLTELAERNPDLVKGLFLSSFSSYIGFDNFDECKE